MKLDLAILVVGGVVALLSHGFLDIADSLAIALLLAYGVVGMLWIVLRARRVMKTQEHGRNGT